MRVASEIARLTHLTALTDLRLTIDTFENKHASFITIDLSLWLAKCTQLESLRLVGICQDVQTDYFPVIVPLKLKLFQSFGFCLLPENELTSLHLTELYMTLNAISMVPAFPLDLLQRMFFSSSLRCLNLPVQLVSETYREHLIQNLTMLEVISFPK